MYKNIAIYKLIYVNMCVFYRRCTVKREQVNIESVITAIYIQIDGLQSTNKKQPII